MSLLQRFNQNYKGIKMSNNAAKFTIRQLLEAGVHYGHRKNFWNPKMEKYIYGTRNGVHIVDLQKTAPMLREALNVLKDVASRNGRILFVGTKKSANELVAEQAARCGQYYVNHRWLGGMLTNWSTVSASIKTLAEYEKILADEHSGLNKKELLDIERKRLKLDNVLGGIRNMGGKPDVVFVIDRRQEDLAIQEARKLGIPVIAVVDTNSSPDDIDYVIPGNDDARKAIELYTSLAAEAILSGMQAGLASSGLDIKPVDMKDAEIANSEMPETMDKPEDLKKASTTVVTKKKKPATKAAAKSE
jgi:small subunit ribosomal protein S2